MAERVPQTYANHGRLDPLYHLFVIPVFTITLVATIVHAVRRPGAWSIWMVVVMVAALVAIFKVRLYALRVQDRVIRLEERLRLASLADASLQTRLGELTEAQLIGLRFASDAEAPTLALRALQEKLSRKEIKKAVREWRADYWRV